MAKTTNTTTAIAPGSNPNNFLVTQSRFATYANLSNDTSNKDFRGAGINAAIAAASEIVRRVCDIDFKSSPRLDLCSGQDSCRPTFLTLLHRPVLSLAAISLAACDGSFQQVTTDRYQLDSDRGTVFGRFPRGYRNVKVEYTGGYYVVPEDVQQATLLIAKSLFDSGNNDATLQAEKIGDYSYSKFTAEGGAQLIPPAASRMLAPYMADPF